MDVLQFTDNKADAQFQAPDAPVSQNSHARISYLDLFFDNTVGATAGALGASPTTRRDATEFAETVAKGVPLFMRGAPGYIGTGLLSGIDQVSPDDTTAVKGVDFALGAGKGLLLKHCYTGMAASGMPGSMRGVTLGILNRSSETAIDWRTYTNAKGERDITGGLTRVVNDTLNPAAVAADIMIFGAADLFEGRANFKTNGRLRYGGMAPVLFSSTVFGMTDGTLREINQQRAQSGADFDYARIMQKGILSASASAISAVPGAYLHARSLRLPQTDFHNTGRREQQLDHNQIALADSHMTIQGSLKGLHSPTFNVTAHTGAESKGLFFRTTDGTPGFAARQQCETTGYALNRLMGSNNHDPVSVAKTIEVAGQAPKKGFVQENAGKSLEDGLREHAIALYGKGDNAHVIRMIRERPELRDRIGEAMTQRMVFGEQDNHFHNYVLGGTLAKPNVGNIDLQYAFQPALLKTDLIPRWKQGYSRTGSLGDQVMNELAGKQLPPETRASMARLADLSKTNPEVVLATGLNPQQLDGVAGRARWFAENGTYAPREIPNYAYRALVRLKGMIKEPHRPVLGAPEQPEYAGH